MARPFARMKLQIDKLNTESGNEIQPQNASYVGVETCRDNKAAILSLFIRLPGNQATGRPVMGRSGLCVGSTLVRVNPSKKSKESKENSKLKKRRNKGWSSGTETATTAQRSGRVQGRAENQNNSTSIPV